MARPPVAAISNGPQAGRLTIFTINKVALDITTNRGRIYYHAVKGYYCFTWYEPVNGNSDANMYFA